MEKSVSDNINCSCKWKTCKRYGKCEECMIHHSKHPKYPLPFCKQRKKIGISISKDTTEKS